MKKILTVLGARPQFIKASRVSHLISQNTTLREVVVHTGQHFDNNMSDIFFNELGMSKPKYFLGINGSNHGDMTGRMLIEIEKVLQYERPEAVMVYGDTNSTLAGALAAAKLSIPIAHVEAGLRSFNMNMPEEINRILTDRISTWLFAPTQASAKYLINEGFKKQDINVVGDVMYDVAMYYGAYQKNNPSSLERLNLKSKNYILATVHRAENTDCPKRLQTIVEGLIAVAQILKVVLPLHPRTRIKLQDAGIFLPSSILLVEPVSYLEMAQLEKNAALILTDSGGVQKEAYFYRVPCVTLRNETEWVELLEEGWNRLAPPNDVQIIYYAAKEALGTQGRSTELYGSGNAACKIVEHLASSL